MQALVIVLVAAALVLSAEAVVCGTWSETCQPYYPSAGGSLNTAYVAGNLQFDGLFAGNYTWLRKVYASNRTSS